MYERNKDLVLVSFFGFIYYAIVVGFTNNLTQVPMGEYFMLPFIISILMGMSIAKSSQMIEWPLCFLFGGTTASVMMVMVLTVLGHSFKSIEVASIVSHTFAWFGGIAAMITVGILLGAFIRATYILVLGSLQISAE